MINNYKTNKVMYTRLGLTTQGEAHGFEKKWDLFLCGSPKVFGMKKGLWDLHSQGGPKFWKRDRDESSSIA